MGRTNQTRSERAEERERARERYDGNEHRAGAGIPFTPAFLNNVLKYSLKKGSRANGDKAVTCRSLCFYFL